MQRSLQCFWLKLQMRQCKRKILSHIHHHLCGFAIPSAAFLCTPVPPLKCYGIWKGNSRHCPLGLYAPQEPSLWTLCSLLPLLVKDRQHIPPQAGESLCFPHAVLSQPSLSRGDSSWDHRRTAALLLRALLWNMIHFIFSRFESVSLWRVPGRILSNK